VIVDGGGAPSLGHLFADVRLRAGRSNDQVVFHLSVAGDKTNAMALGSVVLDHAIEVPLHLLDVIARSGHAARARDVVAADAGDAFRAAIADFLMPNASPPSVQQPSEPIGTYSLRDGTVACGLGLAFGHATAASLEELMRAAAAQGAAGLRTAPDARSDPRPRAPSGRSMAAAAERLGFVVHGVDPGTRIVGFGAVRICSRGIALHRAGVVRADPRMSAASRLGTDFDIHISGCAKGCAHSKQAALTIVGTANGCAMIAGGRPGGVPFATVPTDELPEAIARFADASRREGSEADGHEMQREQPREQPRNRSCLSKRLSARRHGDL
jgi:precorrin-3B synthase